MNFYPRPLRRGRPAIDMKVTDPAAISIHALFAEGDAHGSADRCTDTRFLSTPSSQRATGAGRADRAAGDISIHALFAEGDGDDLLRKLAAGIFLSTPSSQRATGARRLLRAAPAISIHALFAEGDAQTGSSPTRGRFLSTPSSQRATMQGKHPAR